MSALLRVDGLSVRFPVDGGSWLVPRQLHAVRGVSFGVAAGETLGIIGESGCGKSSLIRAAIGLQPFQEGHVHWRGEPIARVSHLTVRRGIQMIFQDPVASLDPRMRVADSIAEPLRIHEPRLGASQRARRVDAVLERVGLGTAQGRRRPHELSGGQCQRVAIARALVVQPALLVCDEPLAALDVSIQAQIVNLLIELQRDDGLALLFVSHNLPVMRRMAHRLMVMHLGEIVEEGPAVQVFSRPRHPYTRALLAAVPVPDPLAPPPASLKGELPSPLDTIPGCGFAGRCPLVMPRCRIEAPALDAAPAGHRAACFNAA